jgi:hypothetical protein
VFEFFKVAAPERVGFAKHRKAAERKVAVLAAADADASETATSPRAALMRKTGRKNVPVVAATAAAEGRARKKGGGGPADSPPAAKRTRVVDVETGVVEDVIAAVPLRLAAPVVGANEETGGPLLVPLSPKEKDSDDSDVRIVSSVGEAPRGRSPATFGAEAPCDECKSSSASTSSSSSLSDSTEQSASPSATGAEKDNLVAAAEEDEEEEEEPDSSNYHVTPENPQAVATRLQVPAEAKLIGEKNIRFLGLTSVGHERKFLEEAGSSFAIPREEEYFGNLNFADLTIACGDLSLKAFVASWCLARRLEQESKKAKELSVAATTSLQSRVAVLEG